MCSLHREGTQSALQCILEDYFTHHCTVATSGVEWTAAAI